MTLEPEDRRVLILHRLKRADETRAESLLLCNNKMLSAAVNRVYYSMFYALNALAISEEFQTGKHAHLIGWFNRTYIRTGKIDQRYSKIISQAFDKRMLGDYADLPEFSKSEVEALIAESEEFTDMIKQMLKNI
jgi:uncharacterized protein (UPF0332 family)